MLQTASFNGSIDWLNDHIPAFLWVFVIICFLALFICLQPDRQPVSSSPARLKIKQRRSRWRRAFAWMFFALAIALACMLAMR